MNWEDLLAAFALYLILEGLTPFFSPAAFKRIMQNLITVPESALRNIGLGSMVAGIVLLYFVR
ncbi:DUF2065 domain-containing protein [Candidatus Spongiihabitans sp.]|uniref:DUF2065 domain-containing protein n=1 Tax=Candidatus Spongiihabitans sp. TaxID=3101308 RepID=UPI003C6FDD81